MQKGGVKQEDLHPQAQPIGDEFHKAGLRTKISAFIKGRETAEAHEVKLPTKDEVEKSIDSLFSSSECKQPSKGLNSGAGIVDAASVYLMTFHHAAAGLGLPGLIASESIAFIKNSADSQHSSSSVWNERRHLREFKSHILSELESKLPDAKHKRQEMELKELIQETQTLFSDIEKKSKEHLDTALKNRLQGVGSSIAALVVNSTLLKPLVDYTSEFFTSFARVQPVQPPGYNPDPAMATIDLAVRVGWFVFTSAFITTLAYEVRGDTSESIEKRDKAREELKGRVESLFGKIQEMLG
ncbi:hypothetical protein H0N98_01075 [Candidatus Micrarchaeota archaeon]|nr:hypothetical protein [Candidatus Micrarchaeota archaeon]